MSIAHIGSMQSKPQLFNVALSRVSPTPDRDGDKDMGSEGISTVTAAPLLSATPNGLGTVVDAVA